MPWRLMGKPANYNITVVAAGCMDWYGDAFGLRKPAG
jgi:hypothetical protein